MLIIYGHSESVKDPGLQDLKSKHLILERKIIYWKYLESLIESGKREGTEYSQNPAVSRYLRVSPLPTITIPHLGECRRLLTGPQASAFALPSREIDHV